MLHTLPYVAQEFEELYPLGVVEGNSLLRFDGEKFLIADLIGREWWVFERDDHTWAEPVTESVSKK